MKYHAKNDRQNVINAVEATEDTTIETEFGPVLVTQGNYVVAMADGQQVGMAAEDLKLRYRKVRSDANKKKAKENA